ncbi:MAG: hypothetical protein NVS3B19_18410 [Ginsengibacter sp.]
MRSFLVTCLWVISVVDYAQLPTTNIWLLDIKGSIKNSNGRIVLSNPKQITFGDGYHNQPSFSKDGKTIYYTSGPQATQTDIYKYSIGKNESSPFTNTKVSEYSPTVLPDQSGICAVVVEPDKRQRIWDYPFSGDAPFALFPTVDSIGYFSWLDNYSLIAFKLGNKIDSNRLLLISGKDQVKVIAQNIGRGLGVYGHEVFFIKKQDTINYLALTDLNSYKILFKPPGNSEHLAVFKDCILMADKGELYAATIISKDKKLSDFVRIQDLSKYGIKNISRIAVNHDATKIALVTSN